jgi:hypothetical protein
MTLAAEQEAAVDAELPPLGERLTDRLNPILVKEVRQSLRGRYFRISFWITLSLATVVGLGVLLVRSSMNEDLASMVHGPTFFVAMFACLAIATQVLVPFSAFLSMGGEWDENTYDLLVLSNLRPRQIVFGKVQSATVQALLFYSSFGPFLVFAFLLRGLDLFAIFVGLAISLAISVLLSCLAVAMSSFSQARFARLALMVLLAVILVQATFVTIAWAGQMMAFPGQLHEPQVQKAIAAAISIAVAVAAFFFASACARLAHPEENRSTGLRLMTLGAIAVGLFWITVIGGGTSVDDDIVLGGVIAAHAVLATATLFFITEPERLGRRVAVSLPSSGLARTLMASLLPGGARGLLFYVLGSTLIAAWALLYSLIVEGRLIYTTGQLTVLAALPLYGLIYLGIPSALFSSRLFNAPTRALARVAILTLFVASILVPALVGFLFGMADWADFEHPLNVFTTIDEMLSRRGEYEDARIVLGIGVVLCAALSVKRVYRGAVELRGKRVPSQPDA